MAGLKARYFFELRPFHAVERGQARYDRFERPAPWQAYTGPAAHYARLAPGADWWTRPLLNRDWQVRARLDDAAGSPLLLTGRYGAGRVAVIATSRAVLGESPAAEALWKATLRWLSEAPANIRLAVPLPIPAVTPLPAKHAARITLRNPDPTGERRVQVVVRILSWERAPVGEERREVVLPKGGNASVEVPLPVPSTIGYEELQARDAFRLRIGVLAAEGAPLLVETTADLDFTPALHVALETEELRARPDLVPGTPDPGQPGRMGLPVQTYAYPPGQAIRGKAVVSLALHNLAPLAAVRDESTPANPTVEALHDEGASAERRPVASEPTVWGFYEGRADSENIVTFTLPEKATLAAVTLVGAGDEYRNQRFSNPGGAVVEVDGAKVAEATDLAERFLAAHGVVRLAFAPVSGSTVRLRLPWLSETRRRAAPRLAEVRIEGTTGDLPATMQGRLEIVAHDALAGTDQSIAEREVSLSPFARVELPFTVSGADVAGAQFLRIEAVFHPAAGVHAIASLPVLRVAPEHPLAALTQLKPADAATVGLIVTRGFREFLERGTGTAEIGEGWGQPDDLVWAYAHGFKQLSANARTRADRLYVSESDLRHYSTPWRQFGSGEEFYDVATPGLVERMKRDPRWAKADTVVLGHSDRWDAGPEVGALHAWQDFEGFDVWLREHRLGQLTGRTHRELTEEVEQKYRGPWDAWNQERYAHDIQVQRDAFAQEGKKLVITAQGVSLVPTPADAAIIGEVVRGMSDDHTWGMLNEDLAFTTARQMGSVAFNPSLAMSTLNQWGYVSGALNNPQWHSPVSTTEPARRVLFDRAFRGMIRPDGRYASMHAYGYNENAGYACTLNEQEYNAWQRVQQKHTLLLPDGPLGLGVVITTAHLQAPENRRFTCGGGSELPETRLVQSAVQRLQGAGLSVAFSANAGTLGKWSGSAPLVLLNVEQCNTAECEALQSLAARGVPLAALCGAEKIPPAVGALFGVSSDGSPAAGKKVGEIAERPVISLGGNLFIPVSAANFIPGDAARLAPLLHERLKLGITFPRGVTGYGFISNHRSFIVAEDWREDGRIAPLRIHARPDATTCRAVETSGHTPLAVHRDGAEWVIDLPLRPGDGALVAFEELP